MSERVTYVVPNTPQGATVTKTIEVDPEKTRIDDDWTYFTCTDNSAIGMPTRWIKEQS